MSLSRALTSLVLFDHQSLSTSAIKLAANNAKTQATTTALSITKTSALRTRKFSRKEDWDAEKAMQVVLGYNYTTGLYAIPPPQSPEVAEAYCETFWEECEHTEQPAFVPDRHITAQTALQCPRISALIKEGLFDPEMVSQEHGMTAEEYKWGCSSVIFHWQEPPQPRAPTVNCQAWWSMCHSMGPEYDPHMGEFVTFETATTQCTRIMDLLEAGHLMKEQIPPQLFREDYLQGCEMYEQTVLHMEDARRMHHETHHEGCMTQGEHIPADPADDCFRYWEDCWYAAVGDAHIAATQEPVLSGAMIATSPKCAQLKHMLPMHMQEQLNTTAGIGREDFVMQCEAEMGLLSAMHYPNETVADTCSMCHNNCYDQAYPMLMAAEGSRECSSCHACHDGCEDIMGYDDGTCHQLCDADKKEGFSGCQVCEAKKEAVIPHACMMRCDVDSCGGHIANPAQDECAQCHAACDDGDCHSHCDMICGHEHFVEPTPPIDHAAGASDGHMVPLGVNGTSVHDMAMQAGITHDQFAAAGIHLSDHEESNATMTMPAGNATMPPPPPPGPTDIEGMANEAAAGAMNGTTMPPMPEDQPPMTNATMMPPPPPTGSSLTPTVPMGDPSAATVAPPPPPTMAGSTLDPTAPMGAPAAPAPAVIPGMDSTGSMNPPAMTFLRHLVR
ncbi:unnamed protein product [Amoebophrya sp. A120]|nr:unnamed protein product [Amoebophrya sp. A120]|eukprot:GSA120T00007606001.1